MQDEEIRGKHQVAYSFQMVQKKIMCVWKRESEHANTVTRKQLKSLSEGKGHSLSCSLIFFISLKNSINKILRNKRKKE